MDTIERHEDIEAALRGELAGRAGSLAIGGDPYPAVSRAARRDRTRRRAGAASGLALAAALVAATPYAIDALHGSGGSTVGTANGGGPSPLLTAPLRGNLAGDAAFIAAAQQRLDNAAVSSGKNAPADLRSATGYKIIYANDDGTHRMVVGAAYTGKVTSFAVLAGDHAAAVSALKGGVTIGFEQTVQTFTYTGDFTGTGESVPFVVLGPTNMTGVQYATGVTLGTTGGSLSRVRTGIKDATTVDGAAAGEVVDATTAAGSAQLAWGLVFRAKLGGKYIDAEPASRRIAGQSDSDPNSPAYAAIKTEVAQQGTEAGLAMSRNSPGGDAVPDNVAMALSDLASFAGVPLGSISYQIDWIGHETAQWDSALLDVSAPGQPKLQLFVRGLASGVPDSASPGLGRSYVRAAVTLTPGHLPRTAAAFGGVPEPSLIGYQLMSAW